MSFEQLDVNKQYDESQRAKKEKEKTDAFLLEKKLLRETSDLLQKLAREISQEFGITISEAKDIISSGTNTSLDELKGKLSNTHENINFSHLIDVIQKARNSIEEASKKNRESLKESLAKYDFQPETYPHNLSKKIFSSQLQERGKNPDSIIDQCIGAGLGIIDSTEAVILFTYALGKGILLTPYHIYLMIRGKTDFPYKDI